MDNSKSYEDANQGRQTRHLSSPKQGSARNPKTSTPAMSPPFYTFQVNGTGKQDDNHHRQEAGCSQATPYESASMDFQSTYGDTRLGPLPAHMSASGSHASFSTAPQQEPIQLLGYASLNPGPGSFEPSSQASRYPGPQYAQANVSPNPFYANMSGNSSNPTHHLSFLTNQYSQQPCWDLSVPAMNGQPGYLLSPAPTYPSQVSSVQGYSQNSFDTTDYSARDMLLPDSNNDDQRSSSPLDPSYADNTNTISPPAAPQPRPQPISARNPTPPPGYMFSSPADLQAAVENDPQRVYNYIRKLNRENVRLQETLGKSKQQTKDEEDRDKRHVAVLERAWDNLSAALVQVNPALANASGTAAQANGPSQAGMPPPARGRGNTRGRGTGRDVGTGRGSGLPGDDSVGQEPPAAPRRSTRRNARKDNEVGNTRAEAKGGVVHDDEDDDCV